MDLETIIAWMEAGTPVLPYLASIYVSYQFMSSVVKPVLRSKRTPVTKHFDSKFWYWVRRLMMFYPGVIGWLVGYTYILCRVDPMPNGNMFYFIMSGMGSQWLVDAGRDWAKSRGYKIPSLRDSLTPPDEDKLN